MKGIRARDCNHHQLQFSISALFFPSSHSDLDWVFRPASTLKSHYFIWIILPWRMCNKQKHEITMLNIISQYNHSVDSSIQYFPMHTLTEQEKENNKSCWKQNVISSVNTLSRWNLRFLFDLLLLFASHLMTRILTYILHHSGILTRKIFFLLSFSLVSL